MIGITYGEIRRFNVEGEEALGLYIPLAGRPVFVDIREDHLTEERKQRAIELCSSVEKLEANLSAFITSHPEFRTRYVTSIGLHSDKLDRSEVFWEPKGYTLIHGLSFVSGE